MDKKEVKRLDFNKIEFEANGHKYYLESEITTERYKWYEKYSLELAYGLDFASVHNNLGNIIKIFNDGKDVEAKAGLYNMYTSLKTRLEDRSDRALRLCTLFILREGENPAEYDLKLANEKIKDWEAEGYSMNDFFTLAFNLIPGLLKALEESSQISLENQEKEK